MTDKAQTKSGTAQSAKSGCCQNETAAKPVAGTKTSENPKKAAETSCCCGTKHEKSAA